MPIPHPLVDDHDYPANLARFRARLERAGYVEYGYQREAGRLVELVALLKGAGILTLSMGNGCFLVPGWALEIFELYLPVGAPRPHASQAEIVDALTHCRRSSDYRAGLRAELLLRNGKVDRDSKVAKGK